VKIEAPNGQEIRSVDEWRTHAPPKKGDAHWKDGKSAKELAKAWFRSGALACPDELLSALRAHELTAELVLDQGWPERVTALDVFPGESRNHDLLLRGRSGQRSVVVGLEAKAGESFGPLIGEYLKSRPAASNVPNRIDGLRKALFGETGPPGFSELRYQLVHGCAATLIEARQLDAQVAVFVVYEFQAPAAVEARNARDWKAFLDAMSATGQRPSATGLSGPYRVPGGGRVPGDIPLLLGKVKARVG
jgi:hypothetical protein